MRTLAFIQRTPVYLSSVLQVILTCLPLAGGHRNRPVIVIVATGLLADEVLQVGTVGGHPVHVRRLDRHASVPGTALAPANRGARARTFTIHEKILIRSPEQYLTGDPVRYSLAIPRPPYFIRGTIPSGYRLFR